MRLILELIVRDILQQLLAGIGVSRCTAYDGPFGGFGVISGKRTGLNPVGERTHTLSLPLKTGMSSKICFQLSFLTSFVDTTVVPSVSFTVTLSGRILSLLFSSFQVTLTPPTIKIVGFLGGSGMAHHHTTTRQRVTRFPTKSYGCSFP